MKFIVNSEVLQKMLMRANGKEFNLISLDKHSITFHGKSGSIYPIENMQIDYAKDCFAPKEPVCFVIKKERMIAFMNFVNMVRIQPLCIEIDDERITVTGAILHF